MVSHLDEQRPAPAPDQPRPRRLTVRSRVLLALLGLTGIAMLLTAVIDYAVDRARLDEEIDQALERGHDEFAALADTGLDPGTGEAFTDAGSLVYVALQRILPEPNAGTFGIIDGEAALGAPSTVTLRPEQNAELVTAATELVTGGETLLTTIDTHDGTYRLLLVPVQRSDDTTTGSAFVKVFDLDAAHATITARFGWNTAVAVAVLIAVGATAWLVVGRILQPIALVRRTAAELGEHDLTRRIPVLGNDDLAELTRTLNRMLDRLQAAFSSQRDMLDDVAHELRTPLTIVQGHLEVMDADDADDTASTRVLVLDELERMDRLVDDLLTLAKADRPDFLHPREVPVGALLDEVLEKARPLADRDWRIEQRFDGTAQLDPQRITQALLQLIGNAVKHSGEAAVVALGAAADADGGTLVLWVRDTGSGISREQQRRIFDRFAQGRPASGAGGELARASPGLGLGLSIVASIATAHGGEVTLHSAPGEGSTFRLVLPWHPSEQNGETSG